jgi:hypothetical protein
MILWSLRLLWGFDLKTYILGFPTPYGLRPTAKYGSDTICDTSIKMTRANNVLKYQSLDQSPVQYIIQVDYSHTTLLFKYKTFQKDDETN